MLCTACRGKLSLFGRRDNYEYHRCLECGTIQLAPLPDEDELLNAYALQYSKAEHYEVNPDLCIKAAQNYYLAIVQALRDFKVSGLVLDYGAGWGGLSQMLLANGFQCQALKISEDMAAYCQKKGLPVLRGNLNTFKEKDGLSALVLCTVFEHLVNHDEWMQNARRLIKTNGLLITLQPTAPFAYFMGRLLRFGSIRRPLPSLHHIFSPPWHTALLTLEGMRALASRNGFELIEIRKAPQGREKGMIGAIQSCLELMNRAGWRLIGHRWPFLTAHLFILRKVRNDN